MATIQKSCKLYTHPKFILILNNLTNRTNIVISITSTFESLINSRFQATLLLK